MTAKPLISLCAALAAVAVVRAAQPPAPQPPPTPPPQQPTDVKIEISGGGGVAPRYAVPDFIALTGDAETREVARIVAEVLWADLDYEREFDMIPRDTYRSIPAATSIETIPFDRWRELNADALVFGTVEKAGTGVIVKMRLFSVKDRRQAYAKEYTGSTGAARTYAHTISDEIHLNQRGLHGVARTKLVFSSDRDSETVVKTVEKRTVKELYVSDYDGANQRRVTINRILNITPAWAPDGRSIAYTSYRRDRPDIYISNIYQISMENPTAGIGDNFQPVFSPDGTKLAFWSNRDGNPEIYVMNRDGSNVRRLTNNPTIDSTPTWSPTGAQIAFTSDRTGSPQIWVIGADGLNLRKITSESNCDRATWSPPPFNEIAFTSRNGPGYDLKIYNLSTGLVSQLTNGEGTNESPAYAPNGRHIAFMSTRRGKPQIFVIDRDGKNLRQLTRDGGNYMPDWSK